MNAIVTLWIHPVYMMFLVGLADIGEAALKHGFHGKETEQHLEMAARNSDDVRRLVDGGRLTKLGGGTFVGGGTFA